MANLGIVQPHAAPVAVLELCFSVEQKGTEAATSDLNPTTNLVRPGMCGGALIAQWAG